MTIPSSTAVLAAMAGVTDGEFASKVYETGCVGKVTIGGFAIGKGMISAAVKSTHRGRNEFKIQSGFEAEFIVQELGKVPSISDTIVNIRVNDPDETLSFIREFSERITSFPIIEVNAHCRQIEFLEKGGGESLTSRPEILFQILSILKSYDFPISLKIRGNSVDSCSFSKLINNWEIDYLHIDSYRNGTIGTDLSLLSVFRNNYSSEIIGNNSVVNLESAKAILKTGVNYFSAARAVKNDPNFFCSLVKDF